MCTISMTFDVPESKHIDIEALKTQVNNFVGYLISVPGIVWQQPKEEEGWEATPDLLARLDKAREEVDKGNCTVLKSKEEINAFLESL